MQTIENLDLTLNAQRLEWMKAEGDDKKKWMDRINRSLDTRLELMRTRDWPVA